MSARIVVSIVTYNSGRYLGACLDGLKNQDYRDFGVCLWDNASTDNSPEIIAAHGDVLKETHFSARNVGFCAGHNQMIRDSDSDYVLVLNPDAVLERAFLDTMVRALDGDPSSGAAAGKLLRWSGTSTDASSGPHTLDSTGVYFTPSQRHLDRGAGQIDSGQFDRQEYVFGASGAAAFYRRRMLDEIGIGGQYFDESFFAYREDADLAWRAQWLGWRCLYVPQARAHHVRRVTPERRSELPADINMHSFKNRFIMRLNNMDAGTYARFFLAITARDLAAFGYVLLRERSSLRAIPLLMKAAPRALALRRAIRRHRRVSPADMRSWFSWKPACRPASPGSETRSESAQSQV